MSRPERACTWFSRLRRTFARRIEMPRASELGEWCRALVSVPERWSGAHRLLAAVAIASAGFALGVQGSKALGLDPNDASGAALADLQRRVDDVRSKASALPALRQAVQALPAPVADSEATQPTAWQSIAAVATRSGMMLQSVEPGERTAASREAGHVVRIEAHSSFASFLAFLSALSRLPVLAVPAELKLERQAHGLVLQAVLEIHDSLPGVPVRPADGIRTAFGDPFVAPPAVGRGPASELRLAGLMIEGTRSLALIEADGEGAIYLPGQMLGNERLLRIGAASVTLARERGTRVLTIGADS